MWCSGQTAYLSLTADLHFPLLFHTNRHCVKPLAANCFHITEQPGDLGGFPRPPTMRIGCAQKHTRQSQCWVIKNTKKIQFPFYVFFLQNSVAYQDRLKVFLYFCSRILTISTWCYSWRSLPQPGPTPRYDIKDLLQLLRCALSENAEV